MPGDAAGVTTDLPNFPYPWYISQVRQMLWTAWQKRMPPTSGEGVVVFSIVRSGAFTDLRMESRSYELFGEGFFFTRKGMAWARANYLGDDPALIDDPRVSPLRNEDLSGVAPALVYTAGFDPLRDEGIAYANKLRAAGVKTIHRNFDSLIHGFVGMGAVIQAAARAMDDIVAGLRHELANLS